MPANLRSSYPILGKDIKAVQHVNQASFTDSLCPALDASLWRLLLKNKTSRLLLSNRLLWSKLLEGSKLRKAMKVFAWEAWPRSFQ